MSALTPAALQIELADQLRHSPGVRGLLCYLCSLLEWRGGARGSDDVLKSMNRLCAAARYATSPQQLRRVEAQLDERLAHLKLDQVDWRQLDSAMERRRLEKAAILKPRVSATEKGVIFVSFEYQWARLLMLPNITELARDYTLVVSPTWSPPHGPINYVFPAVFPDPIFCLISNRRDLEIFPRISPRYRMVPLYASSWVNPEDYQPVPFAEKDIDLLMLANFGVYKRHFALFRALREMPVETKVLLIGQHNGSRTRATLLREARSYGVEGRFELVESASDQDVNRALAHAKTSLILSRREGSCVAVVESMFANTPVGLLEDAEIGSREFVNPATGRLLKHENLGRQLHAFITEAAGYAPRQWALANGLSCHASTAVLNGHLKEHALASGQSWTVDIAAHHWRPNPQLFPADRARMQPAYADIKTRFGLDLGMG